LNADKDKIYQILSSIRDKDLDRISSLDSTTFTIKGWAITLVTALINLAPQQRDPMFLYVGVGTTVLFSTLDYFYGKLRIIHLERLIKIQEYLYDEYLSQIEEIESKFFKRLYKRNFIKDYFIPVFLVYSIMVAVLICLSLFPNLYLKS
jgi:hypothetical protein